jgi:hypothetical protein
MGKRAAILLCIVALVGCSKTIDGSDWEAHKASLEAATQGLSVDELGRFTNAAGRLAKIEVLRMQSGEEAGELRDDELHARGQMKALDGKTVEDVLALHDYSILALRAEEARASARTWQERYDAQFAADPNSENLANYKQYIEEANQALAESERLLKRLE